MHPNKYTCSNIFTHNFFPDTYYVVITITITIIKWIASAPLLCIHRYLQTIAHARKYLHTMHHPE